MANADLNPRDWRDIQVLRAQGVLAELHTVDLVEADRGLRAYAAMTGGSLRDVAQQVVEGALTVSRELCVPALPTRCPKQRTCRPERGDGDDSRRDRRAGVEREVARADL